MSLKRRYRPSANHTGPSAHRVPVYKRSAAALPTRYFAKRGSMNWPPLAGIADQCVAPFCARVAIVILTYRSMQPELILNATQFKAWEWWRTPELRNRFRVQSHPLPLLPNNKFGRWRVWPSCRASPTPPPRFAMRSRFGTRATRMRTAPLEHRTHYCRSIHITFSWVLSNAATSVNFGRLPNNGQTPICNERRCS